MGLFSFLFGNKKQQVLEAIEKGAKIIDVRTVGEFRTDAIEGAINIPLDKLNNATIKKIKKWNSPILVCCASGMRSASATGILKNNGIDDVINAGSWYKLYRWMYS